MFFATAGIEVAPWIPPVVAFAISFFASMGGVSGAVLLLPFQMSVLGYVNPSVSATNHVFNIVGIPGGVYRYFREGRLVWPLTAVVVAGTLPGVLIGAIVRLTYLPDPKSFKLFAAAVLLYIGLRMARDLLPSKADADRGASERRFQELVNEHRKRRVVASEGGHTLPVVEITHFNRYKLGYTFYGERFEVPFVWISLLSFAVGIVGGVYGIGGGAFIAPIFVSVFRLPVYTVAGATLMGTFVTSAAGVLIYQVLASFYPKLSVAPDWSLGILFGLGGLAGMYLGARCQKYAPARAIKWMLASIIVFTAASYVLAFLGR